MAVFMLNICKFNDCGLTFPSLADLILHIEDTHIESDPAVIEEKEQQQPQCLPLSYVLKFYSNSARRESQIVDIKRRLIQHAQKSSLRSVSSSYSDQDDDPASESDDDSNDSWTSEEFSSEYILKHGSRILNSSSITNSDKPFVCPVPGCKKRYKNINGIKYHSKNGHKKIARIRKGFRCHCGKSYKTAYGLKNHSNMQHKHLNEFVATSISQTNISSQIEPIQTHQKSLMINDAELGILTPATSPDSTPDFNHRALLTTGNDFKYHLNSNHCDKN